jgi:hypothetical protein
MYTGYKDFVFLLIIHFIVIFNCDIDLEHAHDGMDSDLCTLNYEHNLVEIQIWTKFDLFRGIFMGIGIKGQKCLIFTTKMTLTPNCNRGSTHNLLRYRVTVRCGKLPFQFTSTLWGGCTNKSRAKERQYTPKCNFVLSIQK